MILTILYFFEVFSNLYGSVLFLQLFMYSDMSDCPRTEQAEDDAWMDFLIYYKNDASNNLCYYIHHPLQLPIRNVDFTHSNLKVLLL